MTEPYRCIVADPPWAPRDKLPGRTRGAARQYRVMETPLIRRYLSDLKLPIADDAILFLWRLSSMIGDALEVAECWGFTVKSEVIWRKLTKTGLPWFGMGRAVRASHEACIIATRGRASQLIRSHCVRSLFTARVPVDEHGAYIHSAKPDEFFSEIVHPLLGDPILDEETGPYLELFARRRRPGWTSLGDELP